MSQYHWNKVPSTLMHYLRVAAAKLDMSIREYLIMLVEEDRMIKQRIKKEKPGA